MFEKLFTNIIIRSILNTSKIEGDVMKLLKGYVLRMYPDEKQEELINKTIGCSRFIYNYFLDDKIKEYKEKAKGFHERYKTNNIKNSYKGKEYNSIKLDLKNRTITLPKLKEVKIRGYRNKEVIIGDIKSAVIKKEAGRYYVSVLIEEELIRPVFIRTNKTGLYTKKYNRNRFRNQRFNSNII